LLASTNQAASLAHRFHADGYREGFCWMTLAELYERAINWPGASEMAVALAVAMCLFVTGFALSFRKPRWLSRILGLVGLALAMAFLFAILERTAVEKPSATITIKRFRHTETTRLQAFIAMIVLPCTAAAVMWIGYLKGRHQLRRQVPRLLSAGRKHFAQRDFDAALREYNQAIQAAPELAEAYCHRGLVYHEMGKTEQAMADLDHAIQCDPRFPLAYLERGKLRTENGDFDGALSDFGQLMVIQANDPATHLQRGVCLVKKGLVDDAVADFYRVLKLTNHSDYAEPAKAYIREVLDRKSGAGSRHPSNGISVPSSLPLTQAQDHPL
jgi:tetratricopeptide (TPR) repeat protein